MRPLLSLAVSLLLAAQSPAVLAAAMYKCVSPDGKVSYSVHECAGNQKQAKELKVAEPSTPEERDRALANLQKLRDANSAFESRQRERDNEAQYERNASASRRHAADGAARVAASKQLEADRAANERGRQVRQAYCNQNPGRC
jgi:hypothetical protein